MRKFIDGEVREFNDNERWPLTEGIAGAGSASLLRDSEGTWYLERVSIEDQHTYEQLEPSRAASVCTQYGVDLPNELVGEL